MGFELNSPFHALLPALEQLQAAGKAGPGCPKSQAVAHWRLQEPSQHIPPLSAIDAAHCQPVLQVVIWFAFFLSSMNA